MDRDSLRLELDKLISEYLEGQGFVLVELIFRYEGPNLFLRILADRPVGGITVGECSMLNNRIGGLLDEKNIIQNRYTLEVSSPGLDRPLRTKNDFLRCKGKTAVFFLRTPLNAKLEIKGEIIDADDNTVKIESENKLIEIPLADIGKAKQYLNGE